MKDISIKFRTICEDKSNPLAAPRLQMIVNTPGWANRLVYSCGIPQAVATVEDKRNLLEAYMNFGHATREDIQLACLAKLAELRELEEPNN